MTSYKDCFLCLYHLSKCVAKSRVGEYRPVVGKCEVGIVLWINHGVALVHTAIKIAQRPAKRNGLVGMRRSARGKHLLEVVIGWFVQRALDHLGHNRLELCQEPRAPLSGEPIVMLSSTCQPRSCSLLA